MDYPGDFPPSPEERAGLRLAANAAWLARAKQRGRAPDGAYSKYPDWEATDEKMMERDNQKAVAAARKAIESERKAHKCYICGRQDLPHMARWYGLWAAGLLGLWLYAAGRPDTFVLGYVGAAAVGAALAAAMYEGIKPVGEQEARETFNKTTKRALGQRAHHPSSDHAFGKLAFRRGLSAIPWLNRSLTR